MRHRLTWFEDQTLWTVDVEAESESAARRNMKGASLHLAADTDISNFLVHQYPLTHRGDQRLVLYSSGDSGIGQQIDEVRLPAGQAPDDAIRSMLGIGKAASRRTAEADGIDSPSPDSQNGYAETTLPNVEVSSAPEDTNLGIIAAESPVEFSRMLNYTKGWDL